MGSHAKRVMRRVFRTGVASWRASCRLSSCLHVPQSRTHTHTAPVPYPHIEEKIQGPNARNGPEAHRALLPPHPPWLRLVPPAICPGPSPEAPQRRVIASRHGIASFPGADGPPPRRARTRRPGPAVCGPDPDDKGVYTLGDAQSFFFLG